MLTDFKAKSEKALELLLGTLSEGVCPWNLATIL